MALESKPTILECIGRHFRETTKKGSDIKQVLKHNIFRSIYLTVWKEGRTLRKWI